MPELTPETQRILQLAREKQCFLLSGGAGSGKTYTLEETIWALTQVEPSSRIACITFTNAAADEIRERVDYNSLWVSTIHDFMWEHIKRYQYELKQILCELINSDEPVHKNFYYDGGDQINLNLFANLEEGIQYREYVRIKDGIISHDQVLGLAARIFELYPKLCRIVTNLFPYIFVDEYQDTSPLVINILLDSIRVSSKNCVIGFFGDAMQAIYDGTVGSLQNRIETGDLIEVKKEQNRRNPRLIIDLANRLRNDGLTQSPSEDPNAPNMVNGVVREGIIRFMYSSSTSLENVRRKLDWGTNGVKELNLTYNLIASQAGFPNLMEIYDGDKILDFVKRIKKYLKDNVNLIETEGKTFGEVVDSLQADKTGSNLSKVLPTHAMQKYMDANPVLLNTVRETSYTKISRLYVRKEQLIDDTKDVVGDSSKPGSQRDELIRHLFRIQHSIIAYQRRLYSEFIRLTDFRLQSAGDKKTLRDAMETLSNNPGMSIGDVIDHANRSNLIQIDDRLVLFKKVKAYIYNRVVSIPFIEFQKLYAYLEGYTPFSTQHKTKGREYRKVLVILDNGGWRKYNFQHLFAGIGSESVLERTSKIFYVCCTRAMDELAIFYHDPPEVVITRAKEWFGEENVVNLDAP